MIAFLFWIAAIILITAGARGNARELLTQLGDDGSQFFRWVLLVGFIYLIGQNDTLRPLSRAFLVLVVVAFILRQGTNVIAGFQDLQN